MGYYTRHSLKVIDKSGYEIDSALVPEFDLENLDGNYSVQDLISGNADSSKWYSHNKEMVELSKSFPEYLFILDGDGEEVGDVWREFYRNGKTYRWELPKIVRPDFDEKKLT
jgi:hypothetical protein